MKLKKTHVIIALVVLLLASIVIALGSFRATNLNKDEDVGLSSTQTPTNAPTLQSSASGDPQNSPFQTQTPQISYGPTSKPVQSPTVSPGPMRLQPTVM